MNRYLAGADVLGADIIDDLAAAERQKQLQAERERLRTLPQRALDFLSAHWTALVVGGAVVAGFFLLAPKGGVGWGVPWDVDEPRAKKRAKAPPVRSYAAIGATSAIKSSALRVRQSQREMQKWLEKQPMTRRVALSRRA